MEPHFLKHLLHSMLDAIEKYEAEIEHVVDPDKKAAGSVDDSPAGKTATAPTKAPAKKKTPAKKAEPEPKVEAPSAEDLLGETETEITYDEDVRPLLFKLLNGNQQAKVQEILNTLGVKSGTALKDDPKLLPRAHQLAMDAVKEANLDG